MNNKPLPDRFRVDETGALEILDPTLEDLGLLQALNPEYGIRMAPLPGFSKPRLQHSRHTFCGSSWDELQSLTNDELCALHAKNSQEKRPLLPPQENSHASLLDLKIEIAGRILRQCHLCGRKCGVDRWRGKLGFCGLGRQAWLSETFVHIAEEPFINPSLLLGVSGCALRCRFCQKRDLQKRRPRNSMRLRETLWNRLDFSECRSLSFIGGNPDESLWAILRFLNHAPREWSLPIVWNCNAYGSLQTVQLLEGVVDVYVPDFKFGNNRCAEKLAGVNNYVETARQAVESMLRQRIPVMCRILVLPGHYECCHAPVLETLAVIASPWLFLSVRPQYRPEEEMTDSDYPLLRRPFLHEVDRVRKAASQVGIQLIED